MVVSVALTRGGVLNRRHTSGIINLYDMLMYGVVEIWLLPSQADLTSCDLLEGHFRRRRNVQAQLLHQDVIRGLANLPCTVKKPLRKAIRQWLNNLEQQKADLPDQGPEDGDRQEESHDASDPHSGNDGRIGVESKIYWLIHPSVEHPWTRATGWGKEGMGGLIVLEWASPFRWDMSRDLIHAKP